MAMIKKFELVPHDEGDNIHLSLHETRNDDAEARIALTLHQPNIGNEAFEATTILLTPQEAADLDRALSELLASA